MYSRLRDGLLAPRAILDYIKDKWYKVLIQILLYAILMTIPTIINIITYDGMNYDEKQEIRQLFNGDEIPFKIYENKLVCTATDKNTVYKKNLTNLITIYANTTGEEVKSDISKYYIVLSEENIYLEYFSMKTKLCSYSDYESLNNFDLNSLGSSSNIENWDVIFNISDKLIKSMMMYTIVSSSIIAFIEAIVFILIFALIISFSFYVRFRNVLKYKAMYKMSVYYTAPFVTGYVIASLFNIGIFYYLGIIISIVYSVVGSTTIISKLMNQGRK